MPSFLNESVIIQIRKIKELVDKFATIIVGSIWILSTLWDIIKFQNYWSDYMLELYSDFLIVFMILFHVLPNKIPKIISDLFGVISNTLGRSIVMLVFSLLFVGDKHLFHNLASIFMLIVGIGLLVMEILAPEIKEGDDKRNFYPEQNKSGNENQERRGSTSEDSNPPSKLDDSQPGPDSNEGDGSGQNKLPSLEDQIKSGGDMNMGMDNMGGGDGQFNFV